MGAIGGLLGLSGGANGTGFAGPTGTNIVNPTNPDQLAAANQGAQNSLQSQQGLLSALQGQNGLQNQSNVYGQLQGVVNGTGPNPAQAMLNQQTGTNVANQAALMAGQRGAGANVGLMARQAAQQGAATQQQAVGQGATMQANQSLAALGQAGSMANTMASNQIGQTNANTSAQQQQQANLLNANAGVNNANVSMQSNINNANAGLANTNIQGQQGLIGGGLQGLSSVGSSLAKGGEVAGYDDGGDVQVSPIAAAPALNFGSDPGAAALAAGTKGMANPMSSSSSGGSGSGGGGGMGSLMGLLAMMAEGGDVPSPMAMTDASAYSGSGPQSKFGQFLKSSSAKSAAAPSQGGISFTGGASQIEKGGQAAGKAAGTGLSNYIKSQQDVPGYSQPDLGSSSPGLMQGSAPNLGVTATDNAPSGPNLGMDLSFARGGTTQDYRNGGKVNAKNSKQKAVASGDNYANDKIPAVLSEHEIVIPRSITLSKDPVRGAAQFVQQTLAKRKMKR